MEKKSKELDCLRQAVTLGLRKRGRTKTFFKAVEAGLKDKESILDGERPDFVILTPQEQNGKRTLLGIEHFRVDHRAIQKKRKTEDSERQVASIGVVDQKNVSDFYNKAIQMHEDAPETFSVEMGKVVKGYVENHWSATYNNFIESFRYTLDKHRKSIDDYYDELNKKRRGKYNLKLGFLIEVHSEFEPLWAIQKKRVKKKPNGLMPMLEDVVQILEDSIDTSKVNFLVFYLSETLETGIHDVIVVPTKGMRKNLERQSIKIYQYCGSDAEEKAFTNSKPIIDAECKLDENENLLTKISCQKDSIKGNRLDWKRICMACIKASICIVDKKECLVTQDVYKTMQYLSNR